MISYNESLYTINLYTQYSSSFTCILSNMTVAVFIADNTNGCLKIHVLAKKIYILDVNVIYFL